MFARLKDNALEIAPKKVQSDGKTIINPTDETLISAGFMPVQYTDQPNVKEGYYAAPNWVQTDTAIVQEWNIKKDNRPLTAEQVTEMLVKDQINALDVDDQTALRMIGFYPEWAAGQAYAAGYKVQRSGKLWRCKDPGHTSQTGWEPSINTASLWEEICESHDGTLDDPIPYSGNMVLENGKYYTQDGVTYICTRDTGNPVYHALKDLVGLYVDIVTE